MQGLPLLEFIQNKFPEITTLFYTINPKRNDSLYDLEPITFSGKGYIIEKLEDFEFKISPKSFFQTNTKQGEQLIPGNQGICRTKWHANCL